MKTSKLISLLAAASFSLPVLAALQTGAKAPDFKAQASLAGKEFTFSLRNALKQGPVVVYFYPSAYTQGCNVQAHYFATNMAEFQAAGATVIGVSLDSIQRLNDFSADPEYCAGKLPVASDASGKIAKSYGLKVADSFAGKAAATMKDSRGIDIGHGFAERVTFVLTRDGKVSAVIGGVGPIDNVKQALAAVQQLAVPKS